MKKVYVLFFLLFLPYFVTAQDLVIKRGGEKINCEIIREDSANIYLVLKRNDVQIQSYISKDDVKSYQYGYYKRQQEIRDSMRMHQTYDKCLSMGFLMGGGSLFGFDAELLLTKSIGVQAGAGIIGFGAGLDFHFQPDIRSSFLSLQYWHQGFADSFSQSLLGPSFVFRARKVFTAQIGLGWALEKGPAWPSSKKQPSVMLTYSIGIYLPG
jgi:hypothetical protein